MRRIWADARCLQDPGFARRGVGVHASAMLRHAREFLPGELEVHGFLDPALPPLTPDHASLLDRTCFALPADLRGRGDPAVFLSLSPMTHATGGLERAWHADVELRAAIVYDFIPLALPGTYLTASPFTRQYLAGLLTLGRFDLLLPISRYSALGAVQHAGVPIERQVVTGAAVRATLRRRAEGPAPDRSRPTFLVVAGADPRKNPEVAVVACASLRPPSRLVIVGGYGPEDQRRLAALHASHGGRADLLEFRHGLSDEELAGLYAEAVAAVCPSRIEGFSLPVVEAAACGTPAIASSCDAHVELVTDPRALFPPDDPAALAARLQALLDDPALGPALHARQADLPARFTETAVARRLWEAVGARLARPAASARRKGARPRIALLTPYPPDRSGVADYSARTVEALARRADVDVYTDAPAPRRGSARRVAPITAAAHLDRGYDRVVSVIGNSHFHFKIIDLLSRFGGAAIVHDNRLTEVFNSMLGPDQFLALARRLLDRPGLTYEEVLGWIADPGTNPRMFFDPLLGRADPLFVHSAPLADHVQRLHGTRPIVLPFCVYRDIPASDLTPAARAAARARLGLKEGAFVVATFGIVSEGKAPHECLWAIETLRSWNVPAELHFVGASGHLAPSLGHWIREMRLQDAVRQAGDWTSEETYRDYLLAADAAIQLRTSYFGGLSGAVLDCIVAGLPLVANEDLAAATEAPNRELRVPDELSPLLLAEALLRVWQAGPAERDTSARREYLRAHAFDRYVDELLRGLGLE